MFVIRNVDIAQLEENNKIPIWFGKTYPSKIDHYRDILERANLKTDKLI